MSAFGVRRAPPTTRPASSARTASLTPLPSPSCRSSPARATLDRTRSQAMRAGGAASRSRSRRLATRWSASSSRSTRRWSTRRRKHRRRWPGARIQKGSFCGRWSGRREGGRQQKREPARWCVCVCARVRGHSHQTSGVLGFNQHAVGMSTPKTHPHTNTPVPNTHACSPQN